MRAPITELGCETFKLDVSPEHDIAAFKERIANLPIDLLLNVAGVMYPQDSETGKGQSHETVKDLCCEHFRAIASDPSAISGH